LRIGIGIIKSAIFHMIMIVNIKPSVQKIDESMPETENYGMGSKSRGDCRWAKLDDLASHDGVAKW
jgi:hypothetical protein